MINMTQLEVNFMELLMHEIKEQTIVAQERNALLKEQNELLKKLVSEKKESGEELLWTKGNSKRKGKK